MKSKMGAEGCGFIFRQAVCCSFEKTQSLESRTAAKTSLWWNTAQLGENQRAPMPKGSKVELPAKLFYFSFFFDAR